MTEELAGVPHPQQRVFLDYIGLVKGETGPADGYILGSMSDD